MRLVTLLPVLLLGACMAASPPPIYPAADPVRTQNVPAALLDAHNRERAMAGVAPLAWDPALAAAAAAYARQLALLGTLRHSPRQARPGQGENLWMGTRGAFPVQAMVANWAAETSFFRPGIFPAVSRSGNWADIGHYSQMIWPATTSLGCAIASGPRFDVLVCRYAPAGNVDGRRVP
jgi:hypothetical protein